MTEQNGWTPQQPSRQALTNGQRQWAGGAEPMEADVEGKEGVWKWKSRRYRLAMRALPALSPHPKRAAPATSASARPNRLQEGRRFLFDVIKVNMFGVKQPRVLVLEPADLLTGEPARLQIGTAGGKTRRSMDLDNVTGIEDAPPNPKAPEDSERSILLRFHETPGSKETKRVILFVSKKQRDAFFEQVARMSPKLVLRRKDGTLTGAGVSGRALGSASSEGGANGGAGSANAEDVYQATEENDYGYGEPRALCFVNVTLEPLLRVEDASVSTAPAAPAVDFHVRRLRHVQRHAVDRRVLRMGFHDGDVLRTVSKRSVFTFRNVDDRERFVAELQELAGPDALMELDSSWNAALPTRQFHRFEATRVRALSLGVRAHPCSCEPCAMVPCLPCMLCSSPTFMAPSLVLRRRSLRLNATAPAILASSPTTESH